MWVFGRRVDVIDTQCKKCGLYISTTASTKQPDFAIASVLLRTSVKWMKNKESKCA